MGAITNEEAKEIAAKKERERIINSLLYEYDSLTRQLDKLNAYFFITIDCIERIFETENLITESIYYMDMVEVTESEFKIGPKYNELVKKCTGTISSKKISFDQTKQQIRETQKCLIKDMEILGDQLEKTYHEMEYYKRTCDFALPLKVNPTNYIQHFQRVMGE